MCDLVQDNAKLLAGIRHSIKEKHLRKCLSLIRLCVTTQKKHYPKAPEIWTEMKASEIPKMLGIIQSEVVQKREPREDDVQRIRAWLEYPQRFHDAYDDMFLPQFMTWEQWMAVEIQKQHAEHTNDEYWTFEWNEKIERRYRKRYDKEREVFYNERK